MKPDIEELRRKYIETPPEGMTSEDIRHMSEDDLLDMDYFLNDDELDDAFRCSEGDGLDDIVTTLSAVRNDAEAQLLVHVCCENRAL